MVAESTSSSRCVPTKTYKKTSTCWPDLAVSLLLAAEVQLRSALDPSWFVDADVRGTAIWNMAPPEFEEAYAAIEKNVAVKDHQTCDR